MSAALLNTPQRQWFSLRWPRTTSADRVRDGLGALQGRVQSPRRAGVVLQTRGRSGSIDHLLGVPQPMVGNITRQLQTALPGLEFEPIDVPTTSFGLVLQVGLSTSHRQLSTDYPEAIAARLQTALLGLSSGEELVVEWLLGPLSLPSTVSHGHRAHNEGLLGSVEAIVRGTQQLDSERRAALRHKQAIAGWRCVLRVAVRAESRGRQRQLLKQVTDALRSAQSPGVRVSFHVVNPGSLGRGPLHWPMTVNVDELVGLCGWPLPGSEDLPIARQASRRLTEPDRVPISGRLLGDGMRRPIAQSHQDARSHTLLVGETGTGKSTLALHLAVQVLEAGQGLVVIEPKDLVSELLARIPERRLDDVVVLDPLDIAPIGLNPLAGSGRAELRVDHLVSIFRSLFADSWGPRTEDCLTSGLLTLASGPHPSLAALPAVFHDAGFRRRCLRPPVDPALASFWEWFDAISPAERSHVLAPLMNKVRSVLLRPALRRVTAQLEPRFDIAAVFTERKALLVPLGSAQLGGPSAHLLGAMVFARLWQVALSRTSLDPARRHPITVILDEWQNYLNLPTDLGDMLAQARGLGLGLVLANQSLSQLSPGIRSAVLTNARTKVVFNVNHADATILTATDDRLTAADVTSLGAFEAYASVLADNHATPFASLRTRPAPPITSDPQAVRARSRRAWGVPVGVIDDQLATITTADPLDLRRGDPGFAPEHFGVLPRRDQPTEDRS